MRGPVDEHRTQSRTAARRKRGVGRRDPIRCRHTARRGRAGTGTDDEPSPHSRSELADNARQAKKTRRNEPSCDASSSDATSNASAFYALPRSITAKNVQRGSLIRTHVRAIIR